MREDRRKFLKISGVSALGLLHTDPTKLAGNVQPQPGHSTVRTLNEKIKAAYDLGLNILKPTRKQLERGLELHRNSVVFDTYGFMPRSAVDGARLAEVANARASALELSDMHEDMSMTHFVDNEREKQELATAWEASGVTCVFQNAGEEGSSIEILLKRLARFTWTTDRIPDIVGKAVTPDDIVKAKSENRRVLYFTGNGVPLPQEWRSAEEELRYIRIFFQLGVRMMHLTYNRRNVIGDGCAETANGGLSDFGRAVVKELNRVGVIPDVAHSGWQTSLEAALVSEKPVVASHTTVASIHKHIRSKPDNVIKAIADKNGYIGICCIPRFLGGSGDIAAMMKHVDYVVKRFGSDYVGIGTDVAYTSAFAADEQRKVPKQSPGRTRWEALWPADNFVESNDMQQSMAWTNWPLFTVGLVQLGYSDEVIQKIIGKNALRVARATFPG
ncbi:MAG TPA: membrane dipeptidase [Chryseosolibacter sp.]|nr:membrane dipeptidase [Chryseosolibacter sp.]